MQQRHQASGHQFSTWSNLGTYKLLADDYLNTSSTGQYGTDTVGLGVEPSNGLTLANGLVLA